MGAIKTMMQEWMDAKGLREEDLKEMDDVNAAFYDWFENERVHPPGSFFDPENFKPLPTHGKRNK
jgi:hypothetical protein